METNTDSQHWLGLVDPDLNPEVQITDSLSADLIRMRNIAVKLKLFNLLAFE
jgi:hypothetical protein